MTRLLFARGALNDLDRLSTFLLASSEREARETAPLLVSGLRVLCDHPLIGRPHESGLRELLISRGRTGYVALYRFDEARDEALVLAIRHQREVEPGGATTAGRSEAPRKRPSPRSLPKSARRPPRS